jgi:hypothetical protein
MKTTAQRFVGAPHNGSTLVRGVFDTKTKTFLDNPKTGKPMVFTKDSALMAAVRAANESVKDGPVTHGKRPRVSKAKDENRPSA